jgi:hypothetical protein
VTHPEPGTTRYLCHLEELCDWHYDVPPPSLDDLAGIGPEPGPETLDHTLNSIIRQGLLRRAKQTDAALRTHLSQHTLEEFLEVIHRLRTGLAVLKAEVDR